MRVLHVIAGYLPATSYGGPVESLHQLLRQQVKQGWSVQVATTDSDGNRRLLVGERATIDGVEVHYYRSLWPNPYGVSLPLIGGVRDDIREADVVHCHGTAVITTTVASLYALASAKPVVVSPHGSYMAWARRSKRVRKSLYRWLDRYAFSRCTFHATSERERADLLAMNYRRVEVIQNGIDIEGMNAPVRIDIRKRFGLRADWPIVLTVGRFDPVKNVEAVVQCARKLDAEFIIAGDHANHYGARIRGETRGAANVHLVGSVSGELKRALFQQATVYVQASHMESYGMAIGEALAVGCPVVASSGCPWREIEVARAGCWGADTPDAIRACVASVLKADRASLSKGASRLAAQHDWAARAKAFLGLYGRLSTHVHGRQNRLESNREEQ